MSLVRLILQVHFAKMSKLCSQNCFYCNTGTLTAEEVTEHVQLLLKDVEDEIQRRSPSYVPNCKFIVNMPKRGNTSLRHCYLWVTNREVHRMLSGMNFDGRYLSAEVQGSASEEPVQEAKSARELLTSMDWGDMSVPEYTRYVPIHNPQFIIGQVDVDRVNKSFVEGKLFCTTPLPPDYATERLNKLFQPFVTSGYLTVSRVRNRATISFSNKDDAYFALCMLRKVRDGDVELSFNYCEAR